MLLPSFPAFSRLVSIVVSAEALLFLPQNLALAPLIASPCRKGCGVCLLLFYLVNYFVMCFFSTSPWSAQLPAA